MWESSYHYTENWIIVHKKSACTCMYQITQKRCIYASVYMYVYNVHEWFTYMYISLYMNGIHICICQCT